MVHTMPFIYSSTMNALFGKNTAIIFFFQSCIIMFCNDLCSLYNIRGSFRPFLLKFCNILKKYHFKLSVHFSVYVIYFVMVANWLFILIPSYCSRIFVTNIIKKRKVFIEFKTKIKTVSELFQERKISNLYKCFSAQLVYYQNPNFQLPT